MSVISVSSKTKKFKNAFLNTNCFSKNTFTFCLCKTRTEISLRGHEGRKLVSWSTRYMTLKEFPSFKVHFKIVSNIPWYYHFTRIKESFIRLNNDLFYFLGYIRLCMHWLINTVECKNFWLSKCIIIFSCTKGILSKSCNVYFN